LIILALIALALVIGVTYENCNKNPGTEQREFSGAIVMHELPQTT